MEIFLHLLALFLFLSLLFGLTFLPNQFKTKEFGLAYYPFTIGILPLCLFTGLLLDKLYRGHKTTTSNLILLLSVCGTASLEIYLIHKQIVFKVGEKALSILSNSAGQTASINYGRYLEYIIYFMTTVLLAVMLNKFSAYMRKRINLDSGDIFYRGNLK